MANKRFTCYVLRYVTYNGVHKESFGVAEILEDQDQHAASQFGLKWHLQKPRVCMAGAVAHSLVIEPLNKPMSESNATCKKLSTPHAHWQRIAVPEGRALRVRTLVNSIHR